MTRFLLFAGNAKQSSHGYVGAFNDSQTAIDHYFAYVDACEYEWGRIYEVPDRGDAFIVWSAQTGPIDALKLGYTAPAATATATAAPDLRDKVRMLEAENSRLLSLLTDKRNCYDSLSAAQTELKKQLNDTVVKLELAKIGRNNAEGRANALQAEVQNLKERLDAQAKVITVAHNETLRYRDLCTQREQEIEQLNNRLQRSKEMYEAATQVQQNLFVSSDKQKSQHRVEIGRLQSLLDGAQQTIERYKLNMVEASKQLEDWHDKLRLETDLRMEAEQKLKAAQQTIETQRLEPEAQQIEWLYSQLAKEQNELSMAREKNAELLTVNSDLRVKVRKLEACEAALRSIAETAQKALREITDENVTGE